jgi:hypothetical protein
MTGGTRTRSDLTWDMRTGEGEGESRGGRGGGKRPLRIAEHNDSNNGRGTTTNANIKDMLTSKTCTAVLGSDLGLTNVTHDTTSVG